MPPPPLCTCDGGVGVGCHIIWWQKIRKKCINIFLLLMDIDNDTKFKRTFYTYSTQNEWIRNIIKYYVAHRKETKLSRGKRLGSSMEGTLVPSPTPPFFDRKTLNIMHNSKLKLCDNKKTITTEHHVFDIIQFHYLIHMSEPANEKLKSYLKTFWWRFCTE